MTIPTPLTRADRLRDHLRAASLSQRGAAKVLWIDERTLRRYCSGDLPVPDYVLLNASRLRLISRNSQVAAMIDAGELSTSDGSLTRDQLLANNAKLWQAIQFLIDRAERPEL